MVVSLLSRWENCLQKMLVLLVSRLPAFLSLSKYPSVVVIVQLYVRCTQRIVGTFHSAVIVLPYQPRRWLRSSVTSLQETDHANLRTEKEPSYCCYCDKVNSNHAGDQGTVTYLPEPDIFKTHPPTHFLSPLPSSTTFSATILTLATPRHSSPPSTSLP